MAEAGIVHVAARSGDEPPSVDAGVSVELLQLLQRDFQRARQQLEEVCRIFGEGEALATQRLLSALPQTESYPIPQHASRNGKPAVNGQPCDGAAPGPLELRPYAGALAGLRVRCLGSFEVWAGPRKLGRWRSLKAKALLKLLVGNRGGPLPKEMLTETLWPECDPEAGGANLKATAHTLRGILGPPDASRRDGSCPPCVVFLDRGYAINPRVGLWVDADELERHYADGRLLEREGEGRPGHPSLLGGGEALPGRLHGGRTVRGVGSPAARGFERCLPHGSRQARGAVQEDR